MNRSGTPVRLSSGVFQAVSNSFFAGWISRGTKPTPFILSPLAPHSFINRSRGSELIFDVRSAPARQAVAPVYVVSKPIDPGEEVLGVRTRLGGMAGNLEVNRARVGKHGPARLIRVRRTGDAERDPAAPVNCEIPIDRGG